MAFDLATFIDEYFTNPLRYPDRYAPYNVYNTVVFAVIALVAVYIIYNLLNRFGIHTNEKFYWAIIPFVFFGSFVRILVDAQVLPRGVELAGTIFYPFVTPVVYVLVFAVVIAALFLSIKLQKENWHSLFSKVGWGLSAIAILPLIFMFKNFAFFAGIVAIVAVVWYVARIAAKKWQLTSMDRVLVMAQGLDGAATFVGVQFGGYAEQHVLGNAIFSAFGGPFAFLVIKVLFAFVVVWVLRKELRENEQQYAYIVLLITIFGLAPGTRDALRILAGV